jgi:hypothetical protein
VRPVSGNLGIGAEMVGSARPLSAIPLSAIAGRLADAADGAITGKLSLELWLELSLELPPELVALGLVASRSVNWSRRSDSSRPFEVSSWYPERDEIESAYHAVTFVLTRTTDPPDAVELTCTADW